MYEDPLWIADHGVERLVRGYLVLKPRRHVHEIADLLPDEAAALGPVITRLHAAMRRALAPERIYVVSTAETLHHLHLHMLPRYTDMPGLGPDLMPALFGEQRWRCSVDEAAQAAEAVRRALATDLRPTA